MPRRQSKLEMTLFPFMSILCGLLAVLLLFMMIILSTRAIADTSPKPKPKPMPQPEADASNREGQEDAIDRDTYRRLSQEMDRMNGMLLARRAERAELERRIAELKDLIEWKKTELLVAIRPGAQKGFALGEPTPVDIVPASEHDIDKRPVLLEVTSDAYIVHPDKRQFPPIAPAGPGANGKNADVDAKLKAFLRDLNANRRKQYLVMLVHPNGVENFQTLRIYITNNYKELDMGWEPFAREWILAK